MTRIESKRLVLRGLAEDDAAFVLDLMNQASYHQFIGDRGVRSLAQARDYIANRIMSSYNRFGYGLYAVLLKEGGIPIGICGLVKRDGLTDADIGFAFLVQFWSKGYASEAAAAVLAYARDCLGLQRILGITMPDNHASIRVLERIGLKFDKILRLSESEPEIKLFVMDWRVPIE